MMIERASYASLVVVVLGRKAMKIFPWNVEVFDSSGLMIDT